MLDDFMTLLVSTVAAAASLTAVALGIEQLTRAARLRRLAALLRETTERTESPEQREVLRSLEQATIASIVAREAVPTRLFVVPIAYVSLVFSWTVLAGYLWEQPSYSTSDVWLWGAPVCFLGAKAVLGLWRERTRVAVDYHRGRTPLTAYTDLISLMLGRRLDFVLGAVASLSVMACGIGLGLALRSSGTEQMPLWVSVGGLFGLYLSWFIEVQRQRLWVPSPPLTRWVPTRPTWSHPSPRLTRRSSHPEHADGEEPPEQP